MTMTPDTPIRPSKGRIAAIALLGPGIGSLVVFMLIGPRLAFVFLQLVLSYSYVFGIVPSTASAFLYAALYPRLGEGWVRWLQCALIGALCGGLGVLPVIWILARAFLIDPLFMAHTAIAGALALPLTALPFRRKS